MILARFPRCYPAECLLSLVNLHRTASTCVQFGDGTPSTYMSCPSDEIGVPLKVLHEHSLRDCRIWSFSPAMVHIPHDNAETALFKDRSLPQTLTLISSGFRSAAVPTSSGHLHQSTQTTFGSTFSSSYKLPFSRNLTTLQHANQLVDSR